MKFDNEGNSKRFGWCCTSTGSYRCCCKGNTKSDLSDLGVGIVVYFKMLKFLTWLFMWFAFINIPTYFFYYKGNETDINNDASLKYFMSVFTLGNIGQCKNIYCLYNFQ
jgi:hypothetical protein